MNRKLFLSIAVVALYSNTFGQEKRDTVAIQEIVVTGQYNAQSIKKSLYKVEVINSETLERMAVNNVAEALNQTLNIMITSEKNSGDSKANVMGLSSQYVKILVDNIPVIGDTGLGSNIDLTKLSVDTVERIEIVKGSMGVEFGNNAVAGVINIITKKSARKKWNIRGFVQEETVGKEYDWKEYGKGRHIQSLNIGHNISEKWFVDLGVNRNDFQGFRGEKGGKNYIEEDGNRGYLWQPKEQINPTFILKYNTPKTQIFYKADYLLEEINWYNPILNPIDYPGGVNTRVAKDRDYSTKRMLHHVNIQTNLFKKIKYSGDFSYQKQSRKFTDYTFDVPARQILSKDKQETYYDAETFYSRGTFNQFLNLKNIDVQAGYELDFTKGFAGSIAGKFGNGENADQKVLNTGIFASAEMPISDNWFLRPGFRMNFSDVFRSTPSYSLVLKNKINEQSEFRAVIGSANRNPTFEELFTYYVEANHNITGNVDLRAENGYSGSLYYSIMGKANQPFNWSVDVSTMYLQVLNKISLATISETPLAFKYINVDTYQSWLNTISGKISNRHFGLHAGFSLLGNSFAVDNLSSEKYFYSPEINASIFYNLLKTKTTFNLWYKYIGKTYVYNQDTSLGVNNFSLKEQNPFSMMDFSISQKLGKEHFQFTLGVRNILDVTNVQKSSTGGSGGAHGGSGPNSALDLFYGRSFFGRLTFNY